MLFRWWKNYLNKVSGNSSEEVNDKPRRLSTIPTTIRLPEDITKELPYVAVFNHRTSVGEQIREWVVQEASKIINKPSYLKFKDQMRKVVK